MKASITTSFGRAYKYGNVITQAPEEVFNNFTYPYNLGEFEKVIDLSRFDVTYYKNDINQEHPVYILKNEYSTQKINLNGESVSTFFTNDKKSIDFVTREEYTDKIIGCGFGVPSGSDVPSNHTDPETAKTDEQDVEPADRYNQVYYGNRTWLYNGNYYGMVPRAQYVYDNLFENGTVDGITPVYYPDDDSMIVRAVDSKKMKVCYYNKLGSKIYMREPMGASWYVGSLAYGGGNIYDNGYNGMFELLQETQTNPKEDTYLTFYPPVPYSDVGINSKMGYGTRTSSRRFDVKTIPIFLRDKNGEYWFWNITRLPSYVDYGYPLPGSFTSHSEYVVKVKDLPAAEIARGVISNTECVWITSEQFTDIGQVDRYLDNVFNPVFGPLYDDGGPDAVGPGDPYEDVGNAGDAIGGNSNIVDDLAVNDKTPSAGMSQYMVSGGLYGAYKLDAVSLQQYANTLNMLYARSANPLIGAIWEQYASRITKNSNSLIMLPYDINETALSIPGPFCLGNACISRKITNTDDSWNDYLFGGAESIAKAQRIITEWSHFETDLGYLDHYYDNFLDFAPYVTASLYLPYIGTVSLPLNLIQSTSDERKHLTLTWNISNLTGDIVCMLNVNDMTIMYWTGNCARTIPLSIDNNGAFIRECTQQIVGSVLGALK